MISYFLSDSPPGVNFHRPQWFDYAHHPELVEGRKGPTGGCLPTGRQGWSEDGENLRKVADRLFNDRPAQNRVPVVKNHGLARGH